MLKKSLIALSFVLPALAVQAQSTPAKTALAARIVKLQQPGIEAMARSMAEQPVLALLQRADQIIVARVAADKREALGKEIQVDVKKYLDEAVPLVRDRAVKLAPQTIGVMLQEKFSEDELKQLAGMLESPVYARYQQLGGEMQKSLLEKLLAETRGDIEPKIKALDQAVANRLGITAPPAAAASAPAKPASK
jgi:hypothetical protein